MLVLQPTTPTIGRRSAAEELRVLPDLAPGLKPGSDAWWARVTEDGTPLSFPDGLRQEDGTRTGVPTLLFLARESAQPTVYLDLNGMTDRTDPSAGTMTAVSGTDLHLAAFGVHPDYLGSYTLIPVAGPLVPPAPRNTPEARAWWLGVLSRSRTDPHARGRRFTGSLGGHSAVARLGDAPALPPSTPNVPEELTWHRPDGVDQRIWLWTPAAEQVGLAFLFDGHMWSDRLPVAPVLADLHRRDAIPPTAAVLIDPIDPAHRSADLAGEDDYLDHLVTDLLPMIEAELLVRGHRRVAEPARTVAAGQSFGGLASFRLAARHPDVVGAVVSQSGSFWWPSTDEDAPRAVLDWLRAQPVRDTRTVLQVGAYEGLLSATNHDLAALIAERGEHLAFREVHGGHDWAWWSEHLADALTAALRP
jgi:iron(III)-enterobactin esterase